MRKLAACACILLVVMLGVPIPTGVDIYKNSIPRQIVLLSKDQVKSTPPIESQPQVHVPEISRGLVETKRAEIMNVSAYTNNDKGMNGKGITTLGTKTKQWETVAAPASIPLGTKLYIPYFKDYPNGGYFIVEDRGGGIYGNRLDVYMVTKSESYSFGRRNLQVYILGD